MRRPLNIYTIALNTTQVNFRQTANTFYFGKECFFCISKTNITLSHFGLTSFFDFLIVVHQTLSFQEQSLFFPLFYANFKLNTAGHMTITIEWNFVGQKSNDSNCI